MNILQFLKKCVQVAPLNPNKSLATAVTWQRFRFNVITNSINAYFEIGRRFWNSQPFVCSHVDIIPLVGI
jgi:hypothetical protein